MQEYTLFFSLIESLFFQSGSLFKEFLIDFDKITSQHNYIFTFFVFIHGLIFGSFFNVVIWRYPKILENNNLLMINDYLNELKINTSDELKQKIDKIDKNFNLSYPSSHCPHCNTSIKWFDNIPLIGWFVLKGKCRNCNEKISFIYPLIELLTASILTLFSILYSSPYEFVFLLLVSLMIIASYIDIKTLTLPEWTTYPIIWIGLILSLFDIFLFKNMSLEKSLLGVIFGFSLPFVFNFIGKKIKGYDVIGDGDFKLLAGIGALGGVNSVMLTFFLSPIVGILSWIALKIFNKNQDKQFPYGPSLIITFLFILVFQ